MATTTEGPVYQNIPVPDPSIITTQQIDKAKDELRRDTSTAMISLKEQIITRIEAMDKAAMVLAENVNRVPTLLDREITRLSQLFEEKMVSIHATFKDRDRLFDERLSSISNEFRDRDRYTDEKFSSIVQEFRDRDRLIDEKFASVGTEFKDHDNLFGEKFGSIQLQFRERDVRTDQDKLAATTAVNAALQAQKEAAGAQNIANAAAINKSETGFTKEIDGLKELINTTKESLASQIVNVNSRLDRGEGGTEAVREVKQEAHMTIGTVMGMIGGVVGIMALIATIIFGVVTSINKNSNGIAALQTRPETLYYPTPAPAPAPAPAYIPAPAGTVMPR